MLPDPPLAFLGVDPGVKGGLALLCGGRVNLFPMPAEDVEAGLWNWLLSFPPTGTTAGLELVTGWSGSPKIKKDGTEAAHGGQPGSRMFVMGQSYGTCRALLTAAPGIDWSGKGIPARVWQKPFGLDRAGMAYDPWKRVLKAHAQALFPKERVIAQVADALLIAEYLRMKHEGEV